MLHSAKNSKTYHTNVGEEPSGHCTKQNLKQVSGAILNFHSKKLSDLNAELIDRMKTTTTCGSEDLK